MFLRVNYARSGALAFVSRHLSTKIDVLGAGRSAFQICGLLGLLLMTATMMLLAFGLGLSLPAVLLLVVVSASAFLAYALAWKMIAGYEEIVYFRGLIAVLLVDALMLLLAGLPVLRYLDILVLGIGIFSACGRAGCGMVGCCHGVPCRHGIRYRQEHANEGFPRALVNVPLIPVQHIEMLWLISVVMMGSIALLRGAMPGSIFAGYLIAYSVGRFVLEFMRGDPERPYWFGLSEAQWTAAAVTLQVASAEIAGLLPRVPWHLVTNGGLLLALAALIILRHLRGESALFEPPHLLELAGAIGSLDPRQPRRLLQSSPHPIPMATTKLGVRITAGLMRESGETTIHFALSRQLPLDARSTRRCARFAAAVLGLKGEIDILRGENGVQHLLIHVDGAENTEYSARLGKRIPDPLPLR